MIKKIWNSPVWSGVIVALILGIPASIAKLVSLAKDETFEKSWDYLTSFKFPTIYLIFALVFLLLVVRLIIWIRERYYTDEYLSPSERLLQRKFNNLHDKKDEVIVKWRVAFDEFDEPYADNLRFFCCRHGSTPIKFINNRCTVPNCPNSLKQVALPYLKNIVDSELIHRWQLIQAGRLK